MDSKYLVRTVTGIAALLIAALVFSLLVCRQESFLGSSFKDMDAYELDIRRMSGTDCHMMELEAGDTLRVDFHTESGAMRLEIKAPDGTAVYSGTGRDASAFTVNISEGGIYPIELTARRAEGTINIRAERH